MRLVREQCRCRIMFSSPPAISTPLCPVCDPCSCGAFLRRDRRHEQPGHPSPGRVPNCTHGPSPDQAIFGFRSAGCFVGDLRHSLAVVDRDFPSPIRNQFALLQRFNATVTPGRRTASTRIEIRAVSGRVSVWIWSCAMGSEAAESLVDFGSRVADRGAGSLHAERLNELQ